MVRTDGAILEIGTISASTVAASIGQAVKKSGRTTGLTRSTVSGLNATISVQYENECAGGAAFTKTFTGQIVDREQPQQVPGRRRLRVADGAGRHDQPEGGRPAVRRQHDHGDRQPDRPGAELPRRHDGRAVIAARGRTSTLPGSDESFTPRAPALAGRVLSLQACRQRRTARLEFVPMMNLTRRPAVLIVLGSEDSRLAAKARTARHAAPHLPVCRWAILPCTA